MFELSMQPDMHDSRIRTMGGHLYATIQSRHFAGSPVTPVWSTGMIKRRDNEFVQFFSYIGINIYHAIFWGETTLHFPDISSMFTDRQPVTYNKRIIWRTFAAFCQLMSSRAQKFQLDDKALCRLSCAERSFYSTDGVYLRNFAGKADATNQTTFRKNRSTKRCLLLGLPHNFRELEVFPERPWRQRWNEPGGKVAKVPRGYQGSDKDLGVFK